MQMVSKSTEEVVVKPFYSTIKLPAADISGRHHFKPHHQGSTPQPPKDMP